MPMKKKLIKKFNKYLDDILLIIGIALISIGVFKIYIPLGYIILGICIIAFAFIYARKEVGGYD